ncbi:MAG: septal ring lytic transglycosylase RlpA family protein [Alphaproteobacteria bacterium]|nr:septal ring lytic transglycosylase RlpA family protein [Alphaproteobacteria bacterium]
MKKLKNSVVLAVLAVVPLMLNACTYGRIEGKYSQVEAIKGQGGCYKVGSPYKIMGKWYYPKEDYSYSEVGTASWYGEDFHAKRTANGEKYDMHALTAAHRTLPLPSIVKVTNLENGRSLVLRVNDRGPYAKNRIIDISKRGAQLLGFQTQGTAKVRVEVMAEESKQLKAALLGNKYEKEASSSSKVVKVAASEKNVKPLQLVGAEHANPKAIRAYPKGSWFVQAGAYSKEMAAQNLSKQLDKFGETNIYYVTVGGQKFYRVRVGPFGHKKEAEVTLAKVKHFGVYNAKVVQD